ncbi:MAG: zinc transporter ZntB [Deltaproteobacteria bacterium]|nr:zinc transporter ZntB [Deltaproteobacteria bacterium]
MSEKNALVCAYLLDGKGGGEALDWTAIDAWKPDLGLIWIHLDSTIDEAQSWLKEKSGLSELTCDSLLDRETRPRTTQTYDGLLVILRGVNCNPGAESDDMVAIRMLFTEKRIISLRFRFVRAVQDIRTNIEAGKGPCTPAEFLVMTAERIADRMGDVVAELDDNVSALEDSVLSADSHELRSQLADLRRASINLRRYIAPQRDAMARLLVDRIEWLAERDRAHLREVAERTARFVDDIDSARERASVTQEELNNRLSEQMNKAMYMLSIVAAIFLPLGLLTGLLGINVGGIPGAEYKWAFAVVCAVLILIGIGLILWFKKIRWL